MRRKYLLDTGFITLTLTDKLPEKWRRPWQEIKTFPQKIACIIEPIFAEAYQQLLKKEGINKQSAKKYIMKIKPIIFILPIDNNDSFRAAQYRIKYESKKSSLSLVDSFLLAVAKRYKLKIYTTDLGLKEAAKKEGIQCNYLPL